MWWFALAALADPVRGSATSIEDGVVAPKNVEIVQQFLEGSVRIVMAGREGDAVFVDGWDAGPLPLATELSEGPHVFRVEGAKGRHQIERMVTLVAGRVTEIDLAVPETPPPPVEPPKPPPARP
jgi:hypothetical protein